MEALYALGKDHQELVDMAKTFERRRCNHREALPESECVTDVVGASNKHRYTLALQSRSLRNHLRTIPGVPLIHFNDRGVLVLEPPSEATLRHKEGLESTRLTDQVESNKNIEMDNIISGPLATSGPIAGAAAAAKRTRKSGPQAPNPLSSRVKKVQTPAGRLSKKVLEEEAERKKAYEERAAKKALEKGKSKSKVQAEAGEQQQEEDENEQSALRRAGKRKNEDTLERDGSVDPTVVQDVAQGGDTDGKRKRKRRKKVAQAGEGEGENGADEA